MKPSLKPKKCKACKQVFEPFSSLQQVCGLLCAQAIGKKEIAKRKELERKAMRKKHREDKERVKRRTDWRHDAQDAFNAYIRERDRDLPCISCGTFNPNIQYCAGHYLTRGARPELAFEPLNVHKQCNKRCNEALSGNQQQYRIGLLLKIGEEAVNWLEGPHAPKKYTIDDFKQIIATYKAKTKALKDQPYYPIEG